MIIELSEGAFADYDEILDYLIRDFGLQYARDFQAGLDYNVGMLKEFPLVGYLEYTNPKTHISYRSLSCKQYKIVYAMLSDRLIIISHWNNRRNPKTLRRILKNHS